MYGASGRMRPGSRSVLSILIWVPGPSFWACSSPLLLRKIVPGGELNTLLYTRGCRFLCQPGLLIWTGIPDHQDPLRQHAAAAIRNRRAHSAGHCLRHAILVTAVLYWFLMRTDTGVPSRHQPGTEASPDGVDVTASPSSPLPLGTALPAVPGAAGTFTLPVPTVGEILVAKCFVIVVLGDWAPYRARSPRRAAGGVESLGAVYVSVLTRTASGS